MVCRGSDFLSLMLRNNNPRRIFHLHLEKSSRSIRIIHNTFQGPKNNSGNRRGILTCVDVTRDTYDSRSPVAVSTSTGRPVRINTGRSTRPGRPARCSIAIASGQRPSVRAQCTFSTSSIRRAYRASASTSTSFWPTTSSRPRIQPPKTRSRHTWSTVRLRVRFRRLRRLREHAAAPT